MKAHTKTATAPTVAAENTRPNFNTAIVHTFKVNWSLIRWQSLAAAVGVRP